MPHSTGRIATHATSADHAKKVGITTGFDFVIKCLEISVSCWFLFHYDSEMF